MIISQHHKHHIKREFLHETTPRFKKKTGQKGENILIEKKIFLLK